jgi:hypothetical protein
LNSLDHRRLVIWMGLWGSSKGSLDWTSWHIEEVGPLNVLRRPGTPVTVRSDQDGHAYVEGQDYGAVHDPAIDAVQGVGDYSEWHTPPSITTRLPAGTRLRVSWYHPTFFYNGNTSACPSDSGTMRLLANEAQAMKSLWGSSGYLLAHDEIRVMNWDASCAAVGGTAGNVLAAHVQKCVGLLRGTQVYAWGDMFDPNQNAVSSYYLVNGDLAGSWKGLDTSVVVLNWDSRHPAQALQFFSGLGHRQIIAGYYDGPVSAVDTWLAAARGVPGVCGVMYATWTDHYADLEAFAAAVRSATARDDRSVHR